MPLEDLKNKANLDEGTDAISSSIICKSQFVRNLNFENYADLIFKKSETSVSWVQFQNLED